MQAEEASNQSKQARKAGMLINNCTQERSKSRRVASLCYELSYNSNSSDKNHSLFQVSNLGPCPRVLRRMPSSQPIDLSPAEKQL
eukprot:1140893-Pelagomonas_calceolata.AAC.4